MQNLNKKIAEKCEKLKHVPSFQGLKSKWTNDITEDKIFVSNTWLTSPDTGFLSF